MRILIVSRHKASIDWILEKNPNAEINTGSVDAETCKKFDLVIGNLPMSIVSRLGTTAFKAIEFDSFPPRGVELTAKDLEKYGIRLVEYVVLQTETQKFLDYFQANPFY